MSADNYLTYELLEQILYLLPLNTICHIGMVNTYTYFFVKPFISNLYKRPKSQKQIEIGHRNNFNKVIYNLYNLSDIIPNSNDIYINLKFHEDLDGIDTLVINCRIFNNRIYGDCEVSCYKNNYTVIIIKGYLNNVGSINSIWDITIYEIVGSVRTMNKSLRLIYINGIVNDNFYFFRLIKNGYMFKNTDKLFGIGKYKNGFHMTNTEIFSIYSTCSYCNTLEEYIDKYNNKELQLKIHEKYEYQSTDDFTFIRRYDINIINGRYESTIYDNEYIGVYKPEFYNLYENLRIRSDTIKIQKYNAVIYDYVGNVCISIDGLSLFWDVENTDVATNYNSLFNFISHIYEYVYKKYMPMNIIMNFDIMKILNSLTINYDLVTNQGRRYGYIEHLP